MRTWRKLKDNPELWSQYFIREKVLRTIRTFFYQRQFHEVETPLVIAHPPAESYVDVFETTLLDRHRNPKNAYLSTSPEVSLKKLLVAGIGNCFSLTKSFRNMETQSKLHNPEFTILEWYRIESDYTALMTDTEELIRTLNRCVDSERADTLIYKGHSVDISPPWERITVADSFKRWAGIDFNEFLDLNQARKIASGKGYKVEEKNTWEELYNQIFLNEVEPKLGFKRPVILYEFPGSMAALSKKKESDTRFAERFEFYIAGLELGDAYSELTDWKEQELRFINEIEEIKRLGKTTYDFDQDFIEALRVGLPECSGIAVGVDRLIMLLADVDSIEDTMFFPVGELFESN